MIGRRVLTSSLIFIFVFGIFAAFSSDVAYYSPPPPTWLKGSTKDRVYQLGLIQPSYADFMLWTGIRLNELYVGGSRGQWEYAKHEALKIKENLQKAALVDTSRRHAIEGLISANYPGLIKAIDSHDPDKFQAAFGRLYASCVACHTKKGVHFIPLIPTTSISPITSGSMELWEEVQKHIREEAQK